MKCPKCGYLGFDTGERCRNCGYDFSLVADVAAGAAELDLDLRRTGSDGPPDAAWLEAIDEALSRSARAPQVASPTEARPESQPAGVVVAPSQTPPLPLFARAWGPHGDEPLIKLPAAPRPPLAVRRTPENARLRNAARPMRELRSEPALEFDDDPNDRWRAEVSGHVGRKTADPAPALSGFGARITAAAFDHGILAAIDVAVVYFTLRIAGLPMDGWASLPVAPLAGFLLLLKWSYFCAFTALGGQTLGKMAVGIRVVMIDDRPPGMMAAARRTAAGTVSAALLGLGFFAAFFDADRRTLHDRVARTRVVVLPAA